MKLINTLAVVCVMVAMVTAEPSERSLFKHIKHGLHHIGHEIKHGIDHVGHEIKHGVDHLGHELGHITGIHNKKDLACKLYPKLKHAGEGVCNAKCVALVSASVYAVPWCPAICHMIFHEADKLAHC